MPGGQIHSNFTGELRAFLTVALQSVQPRREIGHAMPESENLQSTRFTVS